MKDKPNNYPTRKLQEHNEQYNINIPKSIAQAKGWNKKTKLYFKLNKKGTLEIHNV